MNTASLLSARGLSYAHRLGAHPIQAVDGVDLDIGAGEFVAVRGPSGSGKSTLLSLLSLITKPQAGDLRFEQTDIWRASEAQLARVRREALGIVFQQPTLLPALTARENIGYFLAHLHLTRAQRLARSEEALRAVELWDRRDHRPGQLSGGEQQRVALARAMAKKPRIVFCDEPTAHLDQNAGSQLMRYLGTCNEDGTAIVMASHDSAMLRCATRVLAISDGRITQTQEV